MINLRLLISPYFIHKWYLLRDLQALLQKYRLKGKLLDIGCGEKPYETVIKEKSDITAYVGIDFPKYSRNKDFLSSRPDVFFPADYKKTHKLPFRNNAFDTIVSFQVLEHHPRPEKFIEEITRVMKRNGNVVLSAPFIWPIHENPYDFHRFTPYAFHELCKKNGLRTVKIYKEGSIASVIAILLSTYAQEIASRNKIFYILIICMYPFLLGYQYISLLLDKIFPSSCIHMNYLVLASKK